MARQVSAEAEAAFPQDEPYFWRPAPPADFDLFNWNGLPSTGHAATDTSTPYVADADEDDMGALQRYVRHAPQTPPMRIQYGCSEYSPRRGLRTLKPDGRLRPRADLGYTANVDGGEDVAAPPG